MEAEKNISAIQSIRNTFVKKNINFRQNEINIHFLLTNKQASYVQWYGCISVVVVGKGTGGSMFD